MGLKPADLGLPSKFERWNPKQFDVACEIAGASERFRMLDAATGTGKSLMAVAASKLMSAKRTLILTGTKQLQAQYLRDFESIGMRDIRGHGNYRCAIPGASKWEPPCRAPKGGCDYARDVAAALASNLVVTNYAYWLTLGRYTRNEVIGAFEFMVLDEAHTASEWLTSWCEVTIDRSDLRILLDDTVIDLPWSAVTAGDESAWSNWALTTWARIGQRIGEVKELRDTDAMDRDDAERMLARLRAMSYDLKQVAEAPDQETPWVTEKIVKGKTNAVRWCPVWPRDYAEAYLFRGVPNILLTSATLFPDAVASHLGIPKSDILTREVPSPFPVNRRPVIYLSKSERLDFRTEADDAKTQLWVNRIDSIIDDRVDRKGIIHTVSYRRAQKIVNRSRHASRMVMHDSAGAAAAIARFRSSDEPLILVSPSVVEGHDFADDLARYVIIGKVPFVDGRDPVTRARSDSDKTYLNYLAAMAIVQMAGRGVRSMSDWSEVFIVDGHWEWFRNKAKFAKWFKDAWLWLDRVPEPPSIEEVAITAG